MEVAIDGGVQIRPVSTIVPELEQPIEEFVVQSLHNVVRFLWQRVKRRVSLIDAARYVTGWKQVNRSVQDRRIL